MIAHLRALAVVAAVVALAPGCKRRGCLGGDDGSCLPPPPCAALGAPACALPPGALRIGVVGRDAWALPRSPGPKAVAATGDFVLENGRVRAVVDAPDHPQAVAPSGGTILDLAPLGAGAGDQIGSVFQGAGLLPRDVAKYESAEILDRAPEHVALVLRGHLEGDRRVTVVTRYELRPCEAGLRVRSEVYNGARDVNTLALTDGFFWGDRGLLPFVPGRGQGFRHPELDLLELGKAWRDWPFLAARAQAAPFVAYAQVRCDARRGEGFNDPTLSASGVGRVPTLPGDAIAFERFLVVAPGAGLSPAVDEALAARAALFDEPPPARVRGRLLAGEGGAPFPGGAAAGAILFYEPAPGADPDAEAGRTPWSEAIPGPDGRFELSLPPRRRLRALPHAFGRPAGPARELVTGASGTTTDVGDLVALRPARLVVTVEERPGAPADFAEIVLVPADPGPGPGPSLYGLFPGCEPLLGAPHGGSPACNRALAVGAPVELLVPPGRFFVYATRGPFATLGRAEVALAAGDDRALVLRATRLPVVPPGVLGADFHVHGAASFDSSLPEIDRVVSFLAAGVDVVAATDHDVVTDYAEAVAALGVGDRLVVLPGVETTPNILYFDVPGEAFPKTLGHFNFWPLRRDPALPRGGAPWDELREPGVTMDEMEARWLFPGHGVRQMNHAWSEAKLGRDQGFLRAIGFDPRKPLAPGASFAADLLLRRPGGGRRNLDWDAQEVMTGTSRREWMRSRGLWFALLSQGQLRAGTANSDTHSLANEPAGYGRTLVFAEQRTSTLDVVAFDDAVKAGRIVGTNGPFLDARVVAPDGGARGPSLAAFAPAAGAEIVVTVTAVPWVPVSEVRFVVNGEVRRTEPVPLADGGDPAGADRSVTVRAPLAALVGGVRGDAWLVVEAGLPLPAAADLDDDGIAETLDTNGDGSVDRRDVPADDEDDEERRFPAPARPGPDDARFHYDVVAPGAWPYAFTNPFVLDLDGGGWKGPGAP